MYKFFAVISVFQLITNLATADCNVVVPDYFDELETVILVEKGYRVFLLPITPKLNKAVYMATYVKEGHFAILTGGYANGGGFELLKKEGGTLNLKASSWSNEHSPTTLMVRDLPNCPKDNS